MDRRFLIALALVAGGCGAGKPEVSEDFSDLESLDVKSDAFSYRMRIVGSLDYGQTGTVKYTRSPRFRAFKFAGQKGDKIDVWVRSDEGDAVAWVLDNSFRIVGSNDDANRNTLDSHIQVTLPGNRNPAIVTYYVVLRDYDLLDATFEVALKGPAAACAYDGKSYPAGASFPSSDGCYTCSCGPSGQVACTKRACVCNPAAEHHRKYIGSAQQCAAIRYFCEEGTKSFHNACGCGCEQPSDCPEWINCMPGPGRPSCEPERKRCPLSHVAH